MDSIACGSLLTFPNDKKYKCRLGFQPHFGRFINHPHGLQYTVKICGQILQLLYKGVYILCMTANCLFLKSDHYTQVPWMLWFWGIPLPPLPLSHACRCQEWRDEGLSDTGAQLDDLTLWEWDQRHPSWWDGKVLLRHRDWFFHVRSIPAVKKRCCFWNHLWPALLLHLFFLSRV